MIRNERSWVAAGLMLLAALCGCRQAAQPPESPASPTPVAKPAQPVNAAPAADETAMPLTIDEAPVPTAASEVLNRRDVKVNDEPACAMDVRYKGKLDQPVTWSGERCSELTLMFVDVARLKERGRYDSLPEETRDDIARLGGDVLYIEGQFTASIFPLNSFGRIYEEELAD